MRTENRIQIDAPWEKVYAVAAAVEQWPRLLTHYRWVKVQPFQGDRRIVEMAAHRSGLPCRWTAEQRLQRDHKRIFYHHTRSNFTQGMDVWWLLTPEGESRTSVLLTHDIPMENALKGWLRQVVVGEFFVHNVAQKTLTGLKQHLEAA